MPSHFACQYNCWVVCNDDHSPRHSYYRLHSEKLLAFSIFCMYYNIDRSRRQFLRKFRQLSRQNFLVQTLFSRTHSLKAEYHLDQTHHFQYNRQFKREIVYLDHCIVQSKSKWEILFPREVLLPSMEAMIIRDKPWKLYSQTVPKIIIHWQRLAWNISHLDRRCSIHNVFGIWSHSRILTFSILYHGGQFYPLNIVLLKKVLGTPSPPAY